MRSEANEKMKQPIAIGTSMGWIGCPAMLAGVLMEPPREGTYVIRTAVPGVRSGRRGIAWHNAACDMLRPMKTLTLLARTFCVLTFACAAFAADDDYPTRT